MDPLIKVGTVTPKWSAAGNRILSYSLEMWHEGLNEHKIVSAPDTHILKTKTELQASKWIEQWNTYSKKQQLAVEKQKSIEKAESLTAQAEKAIAELENILLEALKNNATLKWDNLKNKDEFNEPPPQKPKKAKAKSYPPKPDKNSSKYVPHISFLNRTIFKSKGKLITEEYEKKYAESVVLWEKEKSDVDAKNLELTSAHNKAIETWESETLEWEKQKSTFLEKQHLFNKNIDFFKESYQNGDPESIKKYCDEVLRKSLLPESIKKEFDLEYLPDSKILIVDYMLPSPSDLPRMKEIKYIQSRNKLQETFHTNAFMNRLYDATVYRLLLRIIHELYEADTVNGLVAVSLNGWVNHTNKATGINENACIATIQVTKEEFLKIDLEHVEPKACFRNLKGIGSSRLSGITPIQPILQISREDRRFIQSYDVTQELDSSTNLATLDWVDFEHLIRELFEKEFSSAGGEVKVTQTSRDGGVDAIAFDPDPIRGGKIVIQAKRYTNIVSVSAIRDLYGTVVNEGATKGILVTTADYGPDAYDFAKDKPLTLLNGGHLLHLLEKHGHKARIDIKEAKIINKLDT